MANKSLLQVAWYKNHNPNYKFELKTIYLEGKKGNKLDTFKEKSTVGKPPDDSGDEPMFVY